MTSEMREKEQGDEDASLFAVLQYDIKSSRCLLSQLGGREKDITKVTIQEKGYLSLKFLTQ